MGRRLNKGLDVRGHLGLILAAVVLLGCGGKGESAGVESGSSASLSSGGEGAELTAEGRQHCAGGDGQHEESSYDTSGDDVPDVRKVFLRLGEGSGARLVLVCRETDLNSDGVKDVVRYYSNEGEPVREEADRNFDGQMDEISFFQENRVIRKEVDTTGNGVVDLKVFFKEGAPERSERDLGGRSTASKWQPDRWEYYEKGRMVRMGTDVDGDGKVDRWDRDATFKRAEADLRSDEDVAPEKEGEGESGEEKEEGG